MVCSKIKYTWNHSPSPNNFQLSRILHLVRLNTLLFLLFGGGGVEFYYEPCTNFLSTNLLPDKIGFSTRNAHGCDNPLNYLCFYNGGWPEKFGSFFFGVRLPMNKNFMSFFSFISKQTSSGETDTEYCTCGTLRLLNLGLYSPFRLNIKMRFSLQTYLSLSSPSYILNSWFFLVDITKGFRENTVSSAREDSTSSSKIH